MRNAICRATIKGALAVLLAGAVTAALAQASHHFDLPSQPLGKALNALAAQAGINIYFDPADVRDKVAPKVMTDSTANDALAMLLVGTGLNVVSVDERTIRVVAKNKRDGAPDTPSTGKPLRPERSDAAPVQERAPDTSMDEKLEEIVVSAQGRTERLQDVPISGEVLGSEAMRLQNLNQLADVATVAPSLHFSQGGRSSQLFVRGIGTEENQSFDQKVGTFIDNIYHGRSRTNAAAFLDLDRIEVLKGPQNIFFGNNAIAGALNIVTQRPGRQFDAWTRALYGEDGQYALEGAVGGPITDTISARAAATFSGLDGWLENETTGRNEPHERRMAGRLTILFTPSEDLDATLKIEGTKDKTNPLGGYQVINCPPPAPFPVAGVCADVLAQDLPAGLDQHRNARPPGEGDELSGREGVLTINYHRWGHTFTTTTGYYNYDYSLRANIDPLPVSTLTGNLPEQYHQFSQEFRIASPIGQPIEYLAGAYFQSDHLNFQQDLNFPFLTPALATIPPLVPYLPLGQTIHFGQAHKNDSAFASATWNATDNFKWSVGLRRSWVEKDYDWNLLYGTATGQYGGVVPWPEALQAIPGALGLGTATTLSGNRRDGAWMPSMKLQYKLGPAALVYASYSRGFKEGGFNGTDVSGDANNLRFGPEYVNAYEVGLKSEWLDRHVLANLAVFRSDYSDLQVASAVIAEGTGTFLTRITNAAEARSQGLELETQWLAGGGFRLSANATYLDSVYESYPNASPTQLQILQGIPFQSLTGQPTSFAPKWSGSVRGTYTMSLGNYLLISELSAILSSDYFLDGTDDYLHRQPSYGRLDGRLTFESADGRWGIDVIGKNLNDHNIYAYMTPGGLRDSLGSSFATMQQPRNFAVQFRYHW